MKTFLSIDVDYWTDADILRRQMHLFMGKLNPKTPIIAVMNHQQMLPEVNESEADRLINIDAHSDVTSADVNKLDCGTWISYVKWRRRGTYLWIRNSKDFGGACNGKGYPWNEESDWKNTESRFIRNDRLSLSTYLRDCVGVGLCMSPAYALGDIVDVFREIVSEYVIPYRKGLVKELHSRTIRPSGFPRQIQI